MKRCLLSQPVLSSCVVGLDDLGLNDLGLGLDDLGLSFDDLGSDGGFQVACQNEKCQVQSPLTLTSAS